MATLNAIESEKLTKRFGDLIAVNEVSLHVESGEIFGLLGPNGAGKTTFISMLVTMKKLTSGKATVNGFDVLVHPDDVRKSIGIIFQDPSLDEELSAYENLDLHAAMYSVPQSERNGRIKEVLEAVELSDRRDAVVKTFSGGMRRRLEIARGLLHRPKILFLDEPTIGLDPQTRAHLWEYVRELRDEHKITVILTTHYLEEADQLCDRIAIIDHGKIVAMDTPAKLKESLGGDVITVKSEHCDQLVEAFKKLKFVDCTKVHDGRLNICLREAETHIPELMDVAHSAGVVITSVTLHKPTLDDVFLHYTGKTIREEEATAKDSMRMRRKAFGHGR